MFGKRLRDLTPADLGRVIAEAELESSELEFKETLPAKGNGEPDSWLSGGGIGDRARTALIAEIIAFANSYGGTLLIGIRETAEKPARAAAINPVPRCAELAERFRMQCRDCIDPQIPLLEAVGIPTEADGSGVVVVHVPKSLMGPHRSTQDFHCYVRRADRTEKMTMREIRDLTLQLDRGIAALDRRFEQSSEAQAQTLRLYPSGIVVCAATAIPLVPISLGRVHNNSDVTPPSLNLAVSLGSTKRTTTIQIPGQPFGHRPLLRGTQIVGRSDGGINTVREIYSDGKVEYRMSVWPRPQEVTMSFAASWLMALIANTLCAVERARQVAGAADVEYALQVQCAFSPPVQLIDYDGNSDKLDSAIMFPRYSVGAREEFARLTREIERDLWDAAGDNRPDLLTVDYDSALKSL